MKTEEILAKYIKKKLRKLKPGNWQHHHTPTQPHQYTTYYHHKKGHHIIIHIIPSDHNQIESHPCGKSPWTETSSYYHIRLNYQKDTEINTILKQAIDNANQNWETITKKKTKKPEENTKTKKDTSKKT